MSTLSRADSSQMAEERIMEEQQKGRSNKKTKKKKKGIAPFQIPCKLVFITSYVSVRTLEIDVFPVFSHLNTVMVVQ